MKESRLRVIKSYYEERYVPKDMGPSRRSPAAFQPFLDWLGAEPGDTLLDVACGSGPLLKCAEPEIQGYGVDLSERAVYFAQRRTSDAQFCIADMQHLPYRNSVFDFVTNIGGLEHVPDMKLALREMARVCADGGRLCIVVPNINFFWYKVSPLEGTKQSAIKEHLLTLDEWRVLIRNAGLSILRIEADPGPDIRTDFGLRAFFRGVLRRAALEFTALLPITLTYQFMFICGKHRINS